MVGVIKHRVTISQNGINVSVSIDFGGNQIPFGIPSHLDRRKPVLFRMNKYFIVFCLMKIQKRHQLTIGYLDQFHCL